MPTYEYLCSRCGHSFEVFQSMKDAPLRKCPKCRKAGLKRLIGSGAGLIFKGTGFYVTDYRKKAPKEDAGKKPAASPPAKDSGKSTPSAATAS